MSNGSESLKQCYGMKQSRGMYAAVGIAAPYFAHKIHQAASYELFNFMT
jgi:hypothetical protein